MPSKTIHPTFIESLIPEYKVRRGDWPITKIQKQPPPRSSGMREMSLSEDEDKSGGDFIRHRDASGRQGGTTVATGGCLPPTSSG
ncbi:hypothetical protein CEXT_270541 [Caerostris extrusa]|uniref:Uncharacterized protein n=1 Tax=Caerostris extrusa TaxID=172846 RepID=A0AAV4SAS6_CAEEX|nr:hypothetical protein CEXT_270541 [Caerostris extrusa]